MTRDDPAEWTDGEAVDDVLVDDLVEWLMARALGESAAETLIGECAERMCAAGLPVARAQLAYRTLHPTLRAMSFTWTTEGGLVPFEVGHDEETMMERVSPQFHLIRNRLPYIRRRLAGPEAELDFTILEELRDEGYTDYLGYAVGFDDSFDQGLIGSWATDRPAGFEDRHLRALLRIQRRLAVAYKVIIKQQITSNIVDTYLGRVAGQRVLDGHIQRGDHLEIPAVIWFGDLRGSTWMSETMAVDDYLAMLNDYFECAAGAVRAEGGEVLLLLGDAVLAIFHAEAETGEAAQAAATGALRAARLAESRLEALNATRAARDEPALAQGIGLHIGRVLYGNIGVAERLQFTVIGRAVNEVARLESLTKTLERPILASQAFADLAPADWQSHGHPDQPGVPEPLEVLSLAE